MITHRPPGSAEGKNILPCSRKTENWTSNCRFNSRDEMGVRRNVGIRQTFRSLSARSPRQRTRALRACACDDDASRSRIGFGLQRRDLPDKKLETQLDASESHISDFTHSRGKSKKSHPLSLSLSLSLSLGCLEYVGQRQ